METVTWMDRAGKKRKSGMERVEVERLLEKEGGAAWACRCERCSGGFYVEELKRESQVNAELEGE